jgi:D-alanyl-D-alanine carboxypeptidase
MRRAVAFLLLLAAGLAACSQAPLDLPLATGTNQPQPTLAVEATTTAQAAAAQPQPSTAPATPPAPAPVATPTATAEPPLPTLPALAAGAPRCGLILPVLAPTAGPPTTRLPGASSVALEAVPEAARPAVRQMLLEPGSVGLAAYELGREEEGVYLNADLSLPLASVVKVIHLIAYAEAVQNGELDPAQPVTLAALEQFYLANSDLSAHPNAVAALRAEGKIFGDPPAVQLADVPRMMMQYSSNAATDYLHMLLGQERLEATIAALGLGSHTAPCPFLGQFLLMSEGEAAVASYLADPERYAADVMAATLAYSAGESGMAQRGWRGRTQRPEISIQEIYTELFNAHGSTRDYALLMGRIADNQFGPWEQNVRIRNYMEWPTAFPANQQTLAWLGYKGGSLPGVLTAAYYAQPWDRARPVVVALFFHDLPITTYRAWRRELPNDELARWLLYEREAISTLRAILSTAQ